MKLSALKIDSARAEQGDWISPGDEYDDLEIKCRGFTDAYTDARAAKLRRAAISHGGDTSKVSSAVQRDIIVEALITHVLLDVRNLNGDDGQPVTFGTFCDLVRNPDYPDLLTACIRAASQAGKVKHEEVVVATGNSRKHSASPSTTAG